jgi:hypothetical protein
MVNDSTVTVDWGDAERRYLKMVFQENWKEADFLQALEKSHELHTEKMYHYLLVDFRIRSIPGNFFPLSRYALTYWQPSVRNVVLVADERRWGKILPLITYATEAFSTRLEFVATIEEGCRRIEQFLNPDGAERQFPLVRLGHEKALIKRY